MKTLKQHADHIFRDCMRGYLFLLLVFLPVFFFYLKPQRDAEKLAIRQAEAEERRLEARRRTEEWKNADPDETLIRCIRIVDNGRAVDAIYINEDNNTVFVCIRVAQNFTREYLQYAYEVEKVFADMAEDSSKPRAMCLVGVGEDGTCYWTMDRQGTVADRNGHLVCQF